MKNYTNHLTLTLLLLSLLPSLAYADYSRYIKGDLSYAARPVDVAEGQFHSGNLIGLLQIQIGIDPTFTPEQEKILIKATQIFIKRATDEKIVQCAFANAHRDLPLNLPLFRSKMAYALAPLAIADRQLPGFFYISRYWDDPTSVGAAFVDLFYDVDVQMPGYQDRHYLHIAINSDHLGSQAQYRFKTNVDYWAGVIAHEIAHNLGYTHPGGYSGSFLTEYGHCVEHNGAQSAPVEGELPDVEIRKNL